MSASRIPVAVAEGRERGGQVRGQGGLPHSAFSTRDREDARALVESDSLRALADAAAELLRQRGLLVRAHDVEIELDGLDALERREPALHLLLEARAQRAACDGERDRDRHVTALDVDGSHHVELGDRAPKLRIDHLLEGLVDLVAEALHPASSLAMGAIPPGHVRAKPGSDPGFTSHAGRTRFPLRPRGLRLDQR